MWTLCRGFKCGWRRADLIRSVRAKLGCGLYASRSSCSDERCAFPGLPGMRGQRVPVGEEARAYSRAVACRLDEEV